MKEKVGSVIMLFVLIAWCSMDVPTNVAGVEDAEFSFEEKELPKDKYLLVRTTYYNPVEEQCDDTPLITADGSLIDKGALKKKEIKWIAISPDLLVEYPLGIKVRVDSKKYPWLSGVYEIHDVMNPRFKYSIDILSHEDHGHIFGTHLCELRKL